LACSGWVKPRSGLEHQHFITTQRILHSRTDVMWSGCVIRHTPLEWMSKKSFKEFFF
jgi:hypothetical protein